MNSLYLSCFMLILLLGACTSLPFVDLADGDNYDEKLNREVLYSSKQNNRNQYD